MKKENQINNIINKINVSNDYYQKLIYRTIVLKQYLLYKNNGYSLFNLDIFTLDNEYIHFDICYDFIINELNRRKGYIYIAGNSINNYYKVGMTKLNPHQRIKHLNSAGVFYELDMIRYFEVHDIVLEKIIHNDLKSIHSNSKYKEFFNLPLNMIETIIQEEINYFNIFLKLINIDYC